MELKTKQYVKLAALVVGVITVIVLISTHPIIATLIAVAGGVFYLVDSGILKV